MSAALLAVTFCRLTVGLMLAVSAVVKLRDLRRFRASVAGYPLVPSRAVPFVSWAVPAVEVVAALLLARSGTAEAGFVLAALVYATFAGAIAAVLRPGVMVHRGCFGERGGAPLAARHLYRDLALFTLALVGLAMITVSTAAATTAFDLPALDGPGEVGSLVSALLVVPAGLTVASIVFLDDLARVLRRRRGGPVAPPVEIPVTVARFSR